MDPVKEAPNIFQRHPELRWLASAVVAAGVIAILVNSLSGEFRSNLSLHATGPEQVISQVRASRSTGYSGTISATVRLGLPPALASALAVQLPVEGALFDGSQHILRYWYGGEDRQRVAVPERNSEQDVYRNGDTVLVWDTARRTLERRVLDGRSAALPLVEGAAALTPPQMADRILDFDADASTATLRSGDSLIGRPVYELDVVPNDSRSLISSVRIQVDGLRSVPLRVQIYARGRAGAVVDVAFQSISFDMPADRSFAFVPPPDAKTRADTMIDLNGVRPVGTGWLQVLSYRTSPRLAASLQALFGDRMRPVKGTWGKGRLYSAGPVSVLITAKGRLLAGAVNPAVLYLAAAE